MFKLKNIRYVLEIFLLVFLASCSDITPINEIKTPPITIIKGNVTKQTQDELILKDQTGQIIVKLFPDNSKILLPNLLNTQIIVYGIIHRGIPKTFDAYVIKTETNQQYILESPTPHLGFIVQSSFK